MTSGSGDEAGHLEGVYGIDDPAEMKAYYDDWAQTYDAELAANGYASPRSGSSDQARRRSV